ncbi:MAG: methyltransferase domain-containing protein [Actinomycetota bacterium]|nr:methyltransferase domain-containing protein [Actinomycetota bacterium]
MTNADWNPEQYGRFAAERAQPFHDLLALVQPEGVQRAVDLGCGPGGLTEFAAARLGLAQMVGIDNSPAMLKAAAAHAGGVVSFQHGDLAEWTSAGDVDLVFANASLQWVADHATVLSRWRAALAPGGQMAVQVPANAYMPSHTVADEVAHRQPYLAAMGGTVPPDPVAANVLEPEAYAQMLFDLGFEQQHVRLQVYPHVLGHSRDVVQWVRGTALTRFQKLLSPDLFEQFVAEYEATLLQRIGDRSPYFFPFRRVLLWGRLPR